MATFTNKKNITIYYQVIESLKPDASTCMLIGGLTRDHTIWRKITPILQKNHQVILLDNRDSGQSSAMAVPYDISDMAEDASELLAHLNLPPIHLVGHSMGGFMAMHIAAKYPEFINTLTLCSTSEKQVEPAKAYLKTRITHIDNQGDDANTASETDIRAMLPKLYLEKNLKQPGFIEEVIAHEAANPHPQSANSFKRQAIACMNHDAREYIKDIACKTLIITGKEDPYYSPKIAHNMASQISDVHVCIINDAAHMIQVEQPEAFCQALICFLSKFT